MQKHLQGIWHHANDSLNLVALHNEIIALNEAPKLDISLGESAQQFVDNLFNLIPNPEHMQHLFVGVLTLAGMLIILLVFLPCLVRLGIRGLREVQTDIHALRLKGNLFKK